MIVMIEILGKLVHTVLPHLLASLLLIQSMTGWCWRCPHDTCPKVLSQAAGQITCHCHEHSKSEKPKTPDNCPRECQGFCVYASTSDTNVELPHFDPTVDSAVIAPLLGGFSTHVSWELVSNSVDSRPPLRLHLLNQSLLI